MNHRKTCHFYHSEVNLMWEKTFYGRTGEVKTFVSAYVHVVSIMHEKTLSTLYLQEKLGLFFFFAFSSRVSVSVWASVIWLYTLGHLTEIKQLAGFVSSCEGAASRTSSVPFSSSLSFVAAGSVSFFTGGLGVGIMSHSWSARFAVSNDCGSLILCRNWCFLNKLSSVFSFSFTASQPARQTDTCLWGILIYSR